MEDMHSDGRSLTETRARRRLSPDDVRRRRMALVLGSGLAFYGASRRNWRGALLTLVGGALAYRAWIADGQPGTVLSPEKRKLKLIINRRALRGVKVEVSTTVLKQAAEIYPLWRDFENLPRLMSHLERVETRPDGTTHWVAKGPLSKLSGRVSEKLSRTISWDAELIGDKPNEMISWRSLPGSEVDSAGSVHFRDLPYGRGCEITVLLRYDPPGGKFGAKVAKLFGGSADAEIREDLRRFKAKIEAGESPTTDGQSSGQTRPSVRGPG